MLMTIPVVSTAWIYCIRHKGYLIFACFKILPAIFKLLCISVSGSILYVWAWTEIAYLMSISVKNVNLGLWIVLELGNSKYENENFSKLLSVSTSNADLCFFSLPDGRKLTNILVVDIFLSSAKHMC